MVSIIYGEIMTSISAKYIKLIWTYFSMCVTYLAGNNAIMYVKLNNILTHEYDESVNMLLSIVTCVFTFSFELYT